LGAAVLALAQVGLRARRPRDVGHPAQLEAAFHLAHDRAHREAVVGPFPHRPGVRDPGGGQVHVVGAVADEHPGVLGEAHPIGHGDPDLLPLRIREAAVARR